MSLKNKMFTLFAVLVFPVLIMACSSGDQTGEKQMKKDARELVSLNCKVRERMFELIKDGKTPVTNDSAYVRLKREEMRFSTSLSEKYGNEPARTQAFGLILKKERSESKEVKALKEKYGLNADEGKPVRSN
ncbi:MAG: hypothetical protein KGZ82_05005 [Bacteroidales bacterium]|nr:hypothetical protein [Bacteroidales bacterium]